MLLLSTSLLPTAALVIGGVQTRRVDVSPDLPWLLEADWNNSGDETIQRHDPLSSCYWPAAAPLAKLIARIVAEDENRPYSYLELGCGTGLCSLTAAASGAASVLATDISATSLEYTAAAATAQSLTVQTRLFDATALDEPLPRADALLLSDVFVTDDLATAFAARVAEALTVGFARILVVDPGRSTRETFLAALVERRKGEDDDGAACFADEDEVARRASEGLRLLLLDTSEGAPVDFCI